MLITPDHPKIKNSLITRDPRCGFFLGEIALQKHCLHPLRRQNQRRNGHALLLVPGYLPSRGTSEQNKNGCCRQCLSKLDEQPD